MIVRLTCPEMLQAAMAGIMRRVESVKLQRRDLLPVKADPWGADVEGALAECALAKGLGVYWAGKGIFRGGDVGALQVRSTPRADGCLLLQPDDDDDAMFWLVTGAMGFYVLRGCIRGRDGKRDEWWEHKPGTHRAAFYVPQSALIEADAEPVERAA